MNYQLIISCFLISTCSFAQGKLTNENWSTHPDIVEVRAIFKGVNTALNDNSLTKYTHDLASQGEYVQAKDVFIDSELRIKLLKVSQSDEGGTYEAQLYYDSKTLLKFIYIVLLDYSDHDADKPIKKEYRIYYGATGSSLEPIWTVKSIDGEQKEMGTHVDVGLVLEDLNILNPYNEFHDED
jgi:hypothetical protein